MLNLPNLLSLARLLSAPLLIIFLINQFYAWALFLFIAASLSDAVDGLLARLLQQRTLLGAYLDPAADKLLSASAYITLAILNILPAWVAVIVVSRDIIICLGLFIFLFTSHGLEIKPSLASKITTIFQFNTVIFGLYFQIKPPWPFLLDFLFTGTAFMTVISGFQYILKGIKIFNQ